MKKLLVVLLLGIACILALSSCNDTPPADSGNGDNSGSHTHAFGEWVTLRNATCTVAGERERSCSCGEKQTQPINAPHTEAVAPAVAATCIENGKTEGKYCSVCEAVLVAQEEIPATGHKKVATSKQILPTCDKEGMSEDAYCSSCREVLSEAAVIPARGYDWILEDGEFKILMIGNSFTGDASNYAYNKKSQLHSILEAMLGDDVKVTVAILVMGDRGLNWHATQAYYNKAVCELQVYTTDSPYWRNYSARTHAEALQWTDWDIVSLQPYGVNPDTGIESNNFPSETHSQFFNIAASTAYLLDLVQTHAPQAEAYCYMHWAFSTDTGLNANLSKYNQMAAFFPSILKSQGTETGKRFTSLVPVGLSVQNARTTYLALLAYNTSAYLDKTLSYETDGQIGLQRDQGHLSYNAGRYIAALTFAEMLIPASLRAENYIIPNIRYTESIGELPEEYSVIAQMAVTEAVENWKEGKLSVADLSYYEKDPTTLFAEGFAGGLSVKGKNGDEQIKTAVKNALENQAVEDLVIEKIEIPESITEGTNFKVTVTVRFGYTTLTFIIDCTF